MKLSLVTPLIKVQGQETHTESWPANLNQFRAWLDKWSFEKAN